MYTCLPKSSTLNHKSMRYALKYTNMQNITHTYIDTQISNIPQQELNHRESLYLLRGQKFKFKGPLIFSEPLGIITMSTNLSSTFQRAYSFKNSFHIVITTICVFGMGREFPVIGLGGGRFWEAATSLEGLQDSVFAGEHWRSQLGKQARKALRNLSGNSIFAIIDPLLYPYIYWHANISTVRFFP